MQPTLRDRFPLSFRKVFKKNAGSIAVVISLWAAASYFLLKMLQFETTQNELFSSGHRMWFMWVFVLLILILWRTGYEILYYFTYFYDMDDKNVLIRKGVMAKTEVTLPFSKITDVYVDQDLMDVVFALYDLHISTPTAESGSLAHIDGLTKERAMELKKIILAKINEYGEKPTDQSEQPKSKIG